VDDPDPSFGEIVKITDPFRIAGTYENDERSAVHHAAIGKSLP